MRTIVMQMAAILIWFSVSGAFGEDDYVKYKAAYETRATRGVYEIVIEYEKRLEAMQQDADNLKLDIKDRDRKIGELTARIMDNSKEIRRLETLCKEAGIATEAEPKNAKKANKKENGEKQSMYAMLKETINNALGKPDRTDIKNALWDIQFASDPKTGDNVLQILWAHNFPDSKNNEIFKMLRAIQETKLQFGQIHFYGTEQRQDKYGKKYETVTVNRYVLKEDIQKINWKELDGVDFTQIVKVSDVYPAWLDRYVTVERPKVEAKGPPERPRHTR